MHVLRKHAANCNTLNVSEENLDARVDRLLEVSTIESIAVIGRCHEPSEGFAFDEEGMPESPFDAARQEFDARAAEYTFVTDFDEEQVGSSIYRMSGTGVSIPSYLYDNN